MSRGSINKVLLIGNLGADPELRFTASGTQVANFSLATSETWQEKSGERQERQERTEWHRIVLWRRLAEIAGQSLKKGSKVYIEGKLQTRNWDDQKGQKHYTTEVVANSMELLDSNSGPADMDMGYGHSQGAAVQNTARTPVGGEDDLPF